MQTILGSGGAIGLSLAGALKSYTKEIRLVSRNPKKVNESDELMAADLTRKEDIDRAIAGSEVVYLCVGFDYKLKVWQSLWPPLMKNVIEACKKHNARLVFFDNVYMYDKDSIPHMTEDAPINPPSEKGKVRAEISNMLLGEINDGKLQALIARSADFIGPKNSLLVEMFMKKMIQGKKCDWFGSIDKIHNFTYTPDAGKATALLGNTAEAYGQVWHLPTHSGKLTMRDWMEIISKETGNKAKYRLMSKPMISIMGVFVPILKEFKEMLYQYEQDYFFDSSKFTGKFDFAPTTPELAIREQVKALTQKRPSE